jgi:transcriptional regulator with XRE-family HTH domain
MSELQKLTGRSLAEDPEFRREYERLGPLYGAISQAITYRRGRGFTQEQLAQRMGKQQPAIARFESGRVWPSLSFLQELAEALDLRLVVRLEPKEEAQSSTKVAETKTTYRPETED